MWNAGANNLMSTETKSSLPETSAGADDVRAPAFPLATGSEIVASLRSDADAWEGCGKVLGFFDAEDEQRNAERVAYLRAAASHIDQLTAALVELIAAEDASCDQFTAAEINRIEAAMRAGRAALSPNA